MATGNSGLDGLQSGQDKMAPLEIAGLPADEDLMEVVRVLESRTEFDIGCCGTSSLQRHVRQRMSHLGFEHVSDYLKLLTEDSCEANRLLRELLIPEQQFFSDPETYRVLEAEVIRTLFENQDCDAPIRVWIPACATGEDAYSLAILILEQAAACGRRRELRILATDAIPEFLAEARRGIYPERALARVSEERLKRWFSRKDDESLSVIPELRDAVTFAIQDLLKDVPFSQMDLVVCRGRLRNLDEAAQSRLPELFHFAIRDGGHLLLGPADDLNLPADRFGCVSPAAQLYRKIPRNRRCTAPHADAMVNQRPITIRVVSSDRDNFAELMVRGLESHGGLAAVLVANDFEIVYFHGPTLRYLKHPAGQPTRNLLLMARSGLRTRLQDAFARVVVDGVPVTLRHVSVDRDGTRQFVRVSLTQVRGSMPTGPLVLVIFEDEPDVPLFLDGREGVDGLSHMELELDSIKVDLVTTIEQLKASNAGLKAAHEQVMAMNEEIMAMNEELRSTNAELEESQSQQQLTLDELSAVNCRLQEEMQSLASARDDFANLLNSTQVATLFLGKDRRIRCVTPGVSKLLNLRPADVGRPVTDIAHELLDSALSQDIGDVMHRLTPIEREVQGASGSWYICRILPFCTEARRVEGVSITWLDVTAVKRAELALRQDKELKRLTTVLRDSSDAIILRDFSGAILSWNRGAARIYGYSEAEALVMHVSRIIPPFQQAEDELLMARLRRGESIQSWETQRVAKGGALIDISLTATMLNDPNGMPIAVSTTEQDITDRKKSERDVVEIAAREQCRIGQDLHDSTGQELTGLSLLTKSLVDKLEREHHPQAPLASRILEGLKRALAEVRELARGLLPVDFQAEGLRCALELLAERVSQLDGISCTLECDDRVAIQDHNVATQVYRIVQEAVTNAVKHANASHISIGLKLRKNQTVVEVLDDGKGIDLTGKAEEGVGLRSMRYRAGLIQASLQIERRGRQGTAVVCTFACRA